MNRLAEKLFELKDEKYADFQAKLCPGIQRNLIIGVRIPECRKLAKQIIKDNLLETDCRLFINTLPHKYYDENMLHGMIISLIKDYEECITKVEQFLPYIDNWAVCDTLSPVCFKKNSDKIIDKAIKWIKDSHVYTVRFGIGCLMKYFLDKNFNKKYLNIIADIKSDEYYINMMIAWYFATALAKQWSSTFPFIKEYKLSKWVHNKTIQKAVESFRITDEQKKVLKSLRVK